MDGEICMEVLWRYFTLVQLKLLLKKNLVLKILSGIV